MSSIALADFETSLRQAQALISREARFSDPPRPRGELAVLGLRGGATVLLVATFERFLRDMFAEHLEQLARRPPPLAFDDLPEKMRITSVFHSLEHATRGRRDDTPRGRIHRLPRIQRAAGLILEGVIDPEALSETGGNPSSETVRELFNQVGLDDVFGRIRVDFETRWGRPEAQNFVQSKLDEVVNSRHRVAHRADALNISRGQLSEWPRFLRILAGLVDCELELYISGLVAPAPAS